MVMYTACTNISHLIRLSCHSGGPTRNTGMQGQPKLAVGHASRQATAHCKVSLWDLMSNEKMYT